MIDNRSRIEFTLIITRKSQIIGATIAVSIYQAEAFEDTGEPQRISPPSNINFIMASINKIAVVSDTAF